MTPIIFLLCGLPGSGKTTYAKQLEQQGVIRLTLDEQLFSRFGREFSTHEAYKIAEEKTKEQLKQELVQYIQAGKSVVVDFGFWKKTERDLYKKLIEDSGGKAKLLYFQQEPKELLQRLEKRNIKDPVKNHVIDEEMMNAFTASFEVPENEGEEVMK